MCCILYASHSYKLLLLFVSVSKVFMKSVPEESLVLENGYIYKSYNVLSNSCSLDS